MIYNINPIEFTIYYIYDYATGMDRDFQVTN